MADSQHMTFHSFIHSFIPAISIAPLQVLYYSEALPTTARILYRSFTPKRTGNCRSRTCPRFLHGGYSGNRTHDPPVKSYRLNQGVTMSHMMRPHDDRSQQSSLGLSDQDSGIRQSRRKIPHSDYSLQKTFNLCPVRNTGETPPCRLERHTEDVSRWLLLPLHEARLRVDRGIVYDAESIQRSRA